MNAPAALVPLPDDLRPHFAWREAPYIKRIIAALEAAEPGCARFVGGCVRDSLLGLAPKDIDVATTLTPDRSIAALENAGLGVAPTGVEHGTVTAIADHKGVEITTLRADVSTDGRRATVAFTRDWEIDAGRRDFTVNAIYLTPDARLFDPVGGAADVKARRVRFIGAPEDRIREDYLRILRFFRFSARFCSAFDAAGLAACAALKEGVSQLSAERIGAEMSGLLVLPRAAFALDAMAQSGVLREVWPADPDLEAAARMKAFDKRAPAPLMLAALYGGEGDGIGHALRLSNAEKSMRSAALKAVSEITPGLAQKTVRELIYRCGRDGFFDALLLAAANATIDEDDFKRMKAIAEAAPAPVMALTGRHVVDAGVAPGPEVSRLLAALEAQWIAEEFPDEARQKVILEGLLATKSS